MSIEPCPHLPKASANNHRTLGRHGSVRGAEFYLDALSYGQSLWQKGHSGRAILALTRALYADVKPNEDVLREWPLPYAALFWILSKHPSDDFPGNPRISFQHQATRIQGARKEVCSARAWAVWALARTAKPTLPGDVSQGINEPTLDAIFDSLKTHGHPNEAPLWQKAFESA